MTLGQMIEAMKAAGCTPQQIGVAAMALVEENGSRSSAAIRQARYRERVNAKKAAAPVPDSVTNSVTGDVTGDGNVTHNEASQPPISALPLAGAFFIGEEVSILPLTEPTVLVPKTETSRQTAKQSSSLNPRAELVAALGDELAAEVVDHRRRMRKPLTPQAAARLAKQFLDTGTPQDAARMMIDRGWQGFNAEWFANARAGPSSAKPAKPGISAALQFMQTRIFDLGQAPKMQRRDGDNASAYPDRLLSSR